MQKELTIKQRSFVKRYVESGNATVSAAEAYDCSNAQTAGVVGFENLKKPKIQKAIHELMTEQGLDDETLLKKHVELLNDPNPAIRMRALETAYKISGRFDERMIQESRRVLELKQDIRPAIVITREEALLAARIAVEEQESVDEWKKQNSKSENW